MNNYEFCAQWVLDQPGSSTASVLDFGCGVGEIVKLLRGNAIEAFGCDVFYAGGDHSSAIDSTLLDDGIIRRIDAGAIPFEADTFDFIVNNQVLEHVEDLHQVLGEMRRVLKPGGMVLSVFPHWEVWREGHSGIPFLHRFAKQSTLRIYYAALLRGFGMGHNKGDKTVMQWSRDFCTWLDDWTSYRRTGALEASFLDHFSSTRHIEAAWLQRRLQRYEKVVKVVPLALQRFIAVKLAGLVIVAK